MFFNYQKEGLRLDISFGDRKLTQTPFTATELPLRILIFTLANTLTKNSTDGVKLLRITEFTGDILKITKRTGKEHLHSTTAK
jgi:hypothetical protein